jgi:hypothetical protein
MVAAAQDYGRFSMLRRRSVLLSALAGAVTSTFTVSRVAAQEATPDAMASHPIVGVWNVLAPDSPSLANFQADGSVTFAVAPSYVDPALGVVFQGSSIGTWEPTGERSIHGTWVTMLSDSNGAFLGTVTIDGYPEASEDGQTLIDDQSQALVTVRDAAGTTLQEMPAAGAPPVMGVRMGVGAPGFAELSAMTGTPTP